MSVRQKLSVVMIAKNAAELLPECLESVSWADEIIVLDSGSSDATAAIAERHGARVYHSSEWHGYGKQRQLAQSYASHPMILTLDSDERVTPELQHAIEQVLAAARFRQRLQHRPAQPVPRALYAPQRLVSRPRHPPLSTPLPLQRQPGA